MKKLLLFLSVLSLAMTACKGDGDVAPKSEIKLAYEVITSSGKWFGEYFDASGKRIQTNPLEQESGWKYEFKVGEAPFQMFLNATSSCSCFGTASSPDVTINFYVNDKLVKTERNNWAKGVTSIVYDVN